MQRIKRTRFKLTVANNAFFALVTVIALLCNYPEVAQVAIGEMGVVTAMYIGGDSYRKSTA